jgi:hypothetical protein
MWLSASFRWFARAAERVLHVASQFDFSFLDFLLVVSFSVHGPYAASRIWPIFILPLLFRLVFGLGQRPRFSPPPCLLRFPL